MLQVLRPRIYGFLAGEKNHVWDLEWDPIPPGSAPAGYHVYRSLDRENWTKLTVDGPIQITTFRDTTAKENYRSKYQYVITWVDGDGTESDTGDATIVHLPFRVQYEWLSNYINASRYRKEWWLDRAGEDVYVLKKLHAGQLCDDCRKFRSQQNVNSRCEVCYGTVYVGGYTAYQTKLGIRQQTDTSVTLPTGVQPQSGNVIVWNVNWPILLGGDDEDIIIRRDGSRYAIQDVRGKVLQGIRIYQMGTASRIDSGHPIYTYSVDHVDFPGELYA